MKKISALCLSFFLLALPALAFQAAAPAPAAAPAAQAQPSLGLTQWDLGTYFGLAAAVVAVVGALKKLFPAWTEGKEPVLGLVSSYALGVSSKLFIPGSFKDVNWVIFLLTLLMVSAGAKFGHDHLLNKIIKNKPDTEEDIEKKTEGENK